MNRLHDKLVGIVTAFGLAALTFTAAQAQTMTLTSPDIKDGGTIANQQVFKGFGCSGDNISPALSWSGAPANTKSFAVSIYDPDAPTGSGWWHWLIFDIAAPIKELKPGAGNVKSEAAPKSAIQSKTDFGTPGYSGPCPTPGSGFHKYIITVYALDVKNLGLDANASPALVGFTLNQHLIQKAYMIMYFKK